MRAALGVLVLCATLVVGFGSAAARADELAAPSREPTAEEIEQARGLFREGNAAADAGEFADALPRFVRAYALSGNPAALFNAARTLRSLGRHVAARDAFEQLLATTPTLSPAMREEAGSLRDEEAARACHLVLEDMPPASPDLVVQLDGALHRDDGGRPVVLDVDAGEHGLLIDLAQHLPFRWQGMLVEGARQHVRVTLSPLPAGRSLAEEPLFWVILGSVLILGGGLSGYVGWDAAQLRPESATVIRL